MLSVLRHGLAGNSEFRNCTPASVLEFPPFLLEESMKIWNIIISILISFYLFLALAIVCDEYFVPAVERLCIKLHMTTDVAGATFMAAATSAPEFFVHMIGTFVTRGDIGIGTIVGSSVFNALAITAFCSLLSGMTISLDWWPISRDMLWYVVSVGALWGILLDGRIYWEESLGLIAIYFVYLITLMFDQRIQIAVRDNRCCSSHDDTITPIPNEQMIVDELQEFYNFKSCPKSGFFDNTMWLLSWPIQVVFLLTIPDCRRPTFKSFYNISLLVCILWISVITYVVAWMITIFGFHTYIPDSMLGITLLAAGTSIPEAASSLIVTKKGYGSMAICNSIGSNSFDILVCLGVPWLIKSTVFVDETGENYVTINSSGLTLSTASLLTTATIYYITFVVSRFVLGKRIGWICLLVYVGYVVLSCVIETNVFGVVNLPPCPIDRHSL